MAMFKIEKIKETDDQSAQKRFFVMLLLLFIYFRFYFSFYLFNFSLLKVYESNITIVTMMLNVKLIRFKIKYLSVKISKSHISK